MRRRLQELFGLTETGSKNLSFACFVAFLVFCVQMLPMMFIMFYLEGILSNRLANPLVFVLATVGIVLALYGVIFWDYNSTYTTVYRESANLRTEIADILRKLPLSYFSSHDLSDLSQTIMSDVERIEHAISHAVSKTVGFLFFFTIASVLMLLGNVTLALCIILPVILVICLMLVSRKIPQSVSKKYWEQLRKNSDSFQEVIELQEEIKAYNLEKSLSKKLYQQMEESEKIHFRTEATQVLSLSMTNIGLRFVVALVVLVGSILLVNHKISLLYFLGYLLATIKIVDGVDGISMNLAELFYINAAVKRIKALRDSPKQTGETTHLKQFTIDLDHVRFAYKDKQEIIKDVSFTIHQNEITALVGPSGCGKTTLLRLISRLYDYQGGHIWIDGHDLQSISTESLFDYISIVFQNVNLFDTSVLENIRLGRPSATDEEVIEAARKANCHEFVDRLPEGYDSLIGENGAKLSGGECQRISIARAILKQAPIIILDEITSSLDIENEKMIQESLKLLLKDKTVIMISHRLKAIENADKIVVLNDGQVDGIGSHDQLLQTSSTYKKLIETSQQIDEFRYKKVTN
ncbi:MAG: ABC transporter ATP-binding protein [Streptococcus sp.]|nr:ABC transporter ATP-binding protein [Streptococcus sp.]